MAISSSSTLYQLVLQSQYQPLFQVQPACLPGCICNEQEHWKTEELLLDHLQEVEITCLRGSQHEVTLLKQLFSWATVLKKITMAELISFVNFFCVWHSMLPLNNGMFAYVTMALIKSRV